MKRSRPSRAKWWSCENGWRAFSNVSINTDKFRRVAEMRIAVSVDEDKGLESAVSHHFGRCPYYVLADVEDREVKAVTTVANPFYQQHQPGQVPGFIHSQGANVIITGGMGRRAITFFQQYDIEPVTGAFGTVTAVLENYLTGGLEGAEPCRESIEHAHHHQHDEAVSPSGDYEKDEAGRLQEEAEALARKIAEVQARIERLKSGS
jgi:predicted Fe-Mo cluster-binding NifX family protein